MRARRITAVLLVAIGVSLAIPVEAEEDDVLRCWWRTSASEVRVGEPFSLVVTCRAAANDAQSAEVDESTLDPLALQMPPFEVLRGARAADLRAAGTRFFQYEYTIRLINELLFERDVPIPDISLTYRVKTATGQGEAILGIERTYVMPREYLHVASLVPDGALDIRDQPLTTFRDNEATLFHANVLVSVGLATMTLGALFALAGAARLFVGREASGLMAVPLLSSSAILRGVRRELRTIRTERDTTGWTSSLIARALAACRVAAACMLGRAPNQRPAAGTQTSSEGALILRHRWPISRPVLVSASVTPGTVDRAADLASNTGMTSLDVTEVQRSLTTFTQAGYAADPPADDDRLDEALADAERGVRSLSARQRWPARALRALRRRGRSSREHA